MSSSSLSDELELQIDGVCPTCPDPETAARLFVRQHVEYAVPDPEQLGELFVTGVEAEQGYRVPRPVSGYTPSSANSVG